MLVIYEFGDSFSCLFVCFKYRKGNFDDWWLIAGILRSSHHVDKTVLRNTAKTEILRYTILWKVNLAIEHASLVRFGVGSTK